MKKVLKASGTIAGGLVTAGLFVWLARDALANAWRKARGIEPTIVHDEEA